MFKIQTLNKISESGLKNFAPEKYEIADNFENPDGIILRSFAMHDMELPASLLAVARAGAGVNNIPIDKCSERGVVVFNTPGANANAVKELAIAGLFLASRKVTAAVDWAKTLKGTEGVAKAVEKGKGAFAGPEIEGKTLLVVGLGAIGVMVANTAYHLGMEVIGYDPYISVQSALSLSRHVTVSNDLKVALSQADYITIHVPLLDDTRGMFNEEKIGFMKDGARVLNFSRGELVENGAMAKALKEGKVACYVTDFPNEEVLEMENAVAIPHLGASTPESEDNCAAWAAKELIDYLENGNIVNSVNFPRCVLPREAGVRVTVAHRNVPNMLGSVLSVFSEKGANVENMKNKSRNEYAYTIVDATCENIEDAAEKIKAIDGVLAVRVIK